MCSIFLKKCLIFFFFHFLCLKQEKLQNKATLYLVRGMHYTLSDEQKLQLINIVQKELNPENPNKKVNKN